MLSKLFRILLLVPAAYWLYLIFLGDMGADPAKTLNHMTGEMALYYLILNLVLGALIALSFRFPRYLRFLVMHRRFLGVITFLYLIFHVFLYLAIEGFETQAFVQIYTKIYLTFGAAAWVILFVLALTSNTFSLRRLGMKRWKMVHRFAHLAAFFAMIHVMQIEKANLIKYGILFALLWSLQAYRFVKTKFFTTKNHLHGV